MPEELHGGAVPCPYVVEDQHGRARRGGMDEHGRHRVEQPCLLQAPVVLGLGRVAGHARGHQAAQLAQLGAHAGGVELGGGVVDVRPQRLDERLERHAAGLVLEHVDTAAAVEDARAAGHRRALELGDQARLPHPGRTGEDQRRALPGQRGAQPRLESRELAAAPDERLRLERMPRPRPPQVGAVGRGDGMLQVHGMLQHAPLHVLEPRAGDGPLLVQREPDAVEDVQRLGRPAAAVEREHQQLGEPLVARVVRVQLLELGDDRVVPAEVEVGGDALDARAEALVLQPPDRLAREVLVGHVGQRPVAAPELERGAEEVRRIGPAAGGARLAALLDQPAEPLGVELVGGQRQPVPARERLDHVVAERLAQPVHCELDPLRRAGIRVAPHLVGQPFGRHGGAGVEDEVGEQPDLCRSGNGHPLHPIEDLDRPQDAEFERHGLGANVPAGRAGRQRTRMWLDARVSALRTLLRTRAD